MIVGDAREFVISALHEVEKYLFNFKRFGKGSVIAPFPRMLVGAKYISIGERCFFGAGLTLSVWDELLGVRHTPTFEVGDRSMLGRDLMVACTYSITIGSSVTVSDRVYIGDSHHGYDNPDVPVLDQPMRGQAAVEIGDGCFIGVGAAILPGVTLGRGCVVAPNAVVTRSFEANTVVLGNPARPIRTYDRSQGRWVP
jgi:acetyltransferase-like isoleucine patch superfamily enzyme